MTDSRPSSPIRRVLLPFCLAWVGGIAGFFVGAAAVPEGSGLAGPATVFVYGVLGGAIGAAGGGLAAWKLPHEAVGPVFTAAVGLSLAAVIVLGVQAVREQRARSASAEQDAARRRAPFSLAAVMHRPDQGSTFIDIEIDGEHNTFVMTVREKPGNPVCRGTVDEQHRVRLLDALRRAEDLLERQPTVCTDTGGGASHTFRWTLPERGGIAREVPVTESCDVAHPEFTALYVPIEGLAFTANHKPGGLTCDAPAAAGQD